MPLPGAEWDRAKRHYVKEVLRESRDKRKVKALMSRNPAIMQRSSSEFA